MMERMTMAKTETTTLWGCDVLARGLDGVVGGIYWKREGVSTSSRR